MFDPRLKKLADVLVNYSCGVKPGERVVISSSGIPSEMVCLLIDTIAEAGGLPFFQLGNDKISRSFFKYASVEAMEIMLKRDKCFFGEMDCYIAVYGDDNVAELSDVPDEKMKIVREHYSRPAMEFKDERTRWVVLGWPTPSMAQLAGMSTEGFEDFYLDVCTLDYAKMGRAVEPLKALMERTDAVRIVGPMDTDITFSIKGIPAVPCVGNRNIPDGEVYTAPVKDSVNGVIHYNAPTIYNGKSFDDVRLVFVGGKIVEASSSDTKSLSEILDTDEGARYAGEFALGINPRITRVMRDILFDEKISGSFHFTPGNSYKAAPNGNKSAVHWDMVMLQTPECGGGEIYFDGELVRKDGLFVPEELRGLNPDNLLSSF